MDRTHWDVIWLHLALNDDYVNGAWFTKTQKMTSVIKVETLGELDIKTHNRIFRWICQVFFGKWTSFIQVQTVGPR